MIKIKNKDKNEKINKEYLKTSIILVLVFGLIAFGIIYLINTLNKSLESASSQELDTMTQATKSIKKTQNVIDPNVYDEKINLLNSDEFEKLVLDTKNHQIADLKKNYNISKVDLNGVWFYFNNPDSDISQSIANDDTSQNLVGDDVALVSFDVNSAHNLFVILGYSEGTDEIVLIGAGSYRYENDSVHLEYHTGSGGGIIENPLVISDFTENYFTSENGNVFFSKDYLNSSTNN